MIEGSEGTSAGERANYVDVYRLGPKSQVGIDEEGSKGAKAVGTKHKALPWRQGFALDAGGHGRAARAHAPAPPASVPHTYIPDSGMTASTRKRNMMGRSPLFRMPWASAKNRPRTMSPHWSRHSVRKSDGRPPVPALWAASCSSQSAAAAATLSTLSNLAWMGGISSWRRGRRKPVRTKGQSHPKVRRAHVERWRPGRGFAAAAAIGPFAVMFRVIVIAFRLRFLGGRSVRRPRPVAGGSTPFRLHAFRGRPRSTLKARRVRKVSSCTSSSDLHLELKVVH